MAHTLNLQRFGSKALNLSLPVVAVALVATGAAYAGADATFKPMESLFGGYVGGSGGRVMSILALGGALAALVGGRFGLGSVAVPIGLAVMAVSGVGIVTGIVSATI